MKMPLLKSVLTATASIILFGCSSVYDKHVEWATATPQAFPVLKAIGQAPISLQNSDNETQRMLLAIKASKLAAYAELAEQVFGQQVNGKTNMQNLVMGDQQLASSINGVIRGARVIKSYPVGDTYTTELELDFRKVYEIYLGSSRNRTIKDVSYY